MKRVGKFLIVFLIILLIFGGLLIFACSFPSSWIKANVESSSKTLNEEGNRKVCFIFEKMQYQEFDNYSDSLMINTAYSIDYKTPMYSAFTAKKDYIPGVTKQIEKDVVGELKSNSKYEKHNEVGELKDTVNGIGEESFEYAKYWHGYLSILRPLLIIFDYQQIRLILTLVLAILAILVTTAIAENKNAIIASFFLCSLVFIEYFYIGLSLINSITFLIMMVASLILIKRFDKIKDFNLFFFVIGMFVGFFCLLDAPLLTLGCPLILYFIYKNGDGKGDFKELIKFSLFWGIGYFTTWMTKWILMDVIYHRNLIWTAIGQVFYRSVGGRSYTLLSVCLNLLSMAIPVMITVLVIIYFFTKYHFNITKKTRRKARIFALIGIIPFLWFIVLSNHSANHFFFVYRILFITMFADLLWAYYVFGEPKRG